MGEVICVVSGKGGVGKSFFSANVSASLADLGKKVLLIDGDLTLRSLDLLLGCGDDTVFDIGDVLVDRADPEKAMKPVAGHPNLTFISAPSASVVESAALSRRFAEFIRREKKVFDVVVIDCSAGLGALVRAAIQTSNKAVVVTVPDGTAVRSAERMTDLIASSRARPFLVINRVRGKIMKKGHTANIDDIIDATHAQLLGVIPEDRSMICLTEKGILPADKRKSPSGKAARNIARRLTGERVPLSKFHNKD